MAPKKKPPAPTPEQELERAFGEALLHALVATYSAWRTANRGKCAIGEVAQTLVYFVGGALAELGLATHLPQDGQWEPFIRDSQGLLRDAMTYCRGQMEGR